MKRTIGIIMVALGLLVVGTSSSWALSGLCGGWTYNAQMNPEPGVGVRGVKQDNHSYRLYDTSNANGYYGLNDYNPPPSGWYDYCAYKQGEGMASTSIYHTQGTSDSWDPHLDGTGGPCPAIPGDK